MSIATEISRLQQAKADIKAAIEGKEVSVPSSATIDEYADYIDAIETGGGGGGTVAESKDVNFYDYDGTIVYSYTAAEFAQLTELPANPTHTGLTAQGWNWTLADAKSHVQAMGYLDIGQCYVTTDGKTRIYIHLEEGRLNVWLGVGINGTVVLDWGDNSPTAMQTGTSISVAQWFGNHTYAAAGDYVITLTVTGSMGFLGESSNNSNSYLLRYAKTANIQNYHYQDCIRKIEIGTNVTSIGEYSFAQCRSLANITIPNSVTSIGSYAFYYCASLANITIPSGVTVMNNSWCYGCYTIASIILPSGITSIASSAFTACQVRRRAVIPNSVTSIESSAFTTNYGLSKLTIPSSVTSIAASAFSNSYGIAEYHFLSTTPPTLANTNAFTNIPSDCKIYVPAASLSAYKGASNWSTYASQIYGE